METGRRPGPVEADTHRRPLGPEAAEGLLAAGEPTEELRARVAATTRDIDQDERDRTLLAELDRIADSNEIRLLITVPLNSVTSRQFAAAFRTHGIDLLAVPTAEAVGWLKGHRFRGRLVTAIRNWNSQFRPGRRSASMSP